SEADRCLAAAPASTPAPTRTTAARAAARGESTPPKNRAGSDGCAAGEESAPRDVLGSLVSCGPRHQLSTSFSLTRSVVTDLWSMMATVSSARARVDRK